jgi:small subunit ribosomal protein S6
MNEYELTYIRRVNLDQEKIDRMESRISRAFEKHGGEVMLTQDLGERTLAYLIEKEAKGQYIQLNLLGTGNLVDEIEGLFRISPEILRFLTIRLARNVDLEQKKKEYIEKKAAPPSQEDREEEAAASV